MLELRGKWHDSLWRARVVWYDQRAALGGRMGFGSSVTALAPLFLVICTSSLLAGQSAQTQRDACFRADPRIAPDLRIAACASLIQSGPQDTNILIGALSFRGIAFRQKGDNDHAIQDFDQAIRLNAKFIDAYANRGAAYSAQGKQDKAIEDFDQAIKLAPNDFQAFMNRGVAYAATGDQDRAIQDYDQAIFFNPRLAAAYY